MKIRFTKKVYLGLVEEDGTTFNQLFESGDEESVQIVSDYNKYVDLEFDDGSMSYAVSKDCFMDVT